MGAELVALSTQLSRCQYQLVVAAAAFAESAERVLDGSRTPAHERDRHCVDCGRYDLLEYDHVPAYETTHHTVIDELQVRCAPCHHQRHHPPTT